MLELKSNPIVEALEGNESAVQIEGYVGRTENGRVRVYSGLDLGSYVAVDAKDVVHVTEGGQDDEPARLYLREGAEVKVVTTMKAAALRQRPGQTGGGVKTSCADKSFDFWWDCVQRPGSNIDDCTARSKSIERMCELIDSAFAGGLTI